MDPDIDLPALVAGGAISVRLVAGSIVVTAVVGLVAAQRRVPGAALVVAALDRLSGTMLGFERWVVDPIFGALEHTIVAAAWIAQVLDTELLAPPADAAARRAVRAAGAVRPVVGGSLERIFWACTALLAAACLACALWLVR